MPRPKAREDWPEYQSQIAAHLRSMRSAQDVREHETQRRRWLGEEPGLVEQGVRAMVAWWETARMLDENAERAQEWRDRKAAEGAASEEVA